MKKLLAAIALLVYFTASNGVVINSHYCMKRLVSVHLFKNRSDKCGLRGMDMHEESGCCHDEVKVLKLVQDQRKTPVTVYNFTCPILAKYSDSFYAIEQIAEIRLYYIKHSPTFFIKQDIWLKNNVFRI